MPVRRWGAILGALLLVLAVALVWTPGGGDADMGEIKSPLRRTIMGLNNTAPKAYWPMEDDSGAGSATALVGGRPLAAVDSGPVAGSSLRPDGSAGAWSFTDGGYLAGSTTLGSGEPTSWEMELSGGYSTFPTDGEAGITILTANIVGTSGGTGPMYSFTTSYTIDEEWHWGFQFFTDPDDNTPAFTSSLDDVTKMAEGRVDHLRLKVTQDGSDVDMVFYVNGTESISTSETMTLGRPGQVSVNKAAPALSFGERPGANLDSVSHLAIWMPARSSTSYSYRAFQAWVGETATDRLTRLCTEAGIALDIAS